MKLISEPAGKRFAMGLNLLLRELESPGVTERALLECMLGYAAGRLMGNGASRADVRKVLEGVLQHLPEVNN